MAFAQMVSKGMRTVLLAGLAAISLLGLGACSVQVRVGKAPDRRVDRPGGTPVPAEGIPGFVAFNPASGRYRIAYPAEWVAKEGGSSGAVAADMFLPPSSGGIPNVNLVCQTVPAGTSTSEFLRVGDQYLKEQLNVQPDESESASFGGEEVPVVKFAFAYGGRQLDVAQVSVVHGTCGWTLTLNAEVGQRDTYFPAFATMYASFAPAD